LQALEEREVFAANVVSSQVGGVLTLTAVDVFAPQAAVVAGDNDNKLSIKRTGANSYSIGGLDANSTVDGQGAKSFADVTSIVLRLGLGNDEVLYSTALPQGTPLATLTYFGGDGNNILTFDASGEDNLLTNLTVTNGDGADTLRFRNGTNSVTGTLKVSNGVGDSTIELGTAGTDITDLGTLSITNGAGFDRLVAVGAVHVSGKLTIRNGNGGSSTTFNTSSLQLDGAFSLTNGSGFDNVVIGTSSAPSSVNVKNVTIANGHGGASVGIIAANGTTISGNLAVTNGVGNDTFQVTGASFTVTGTVTMKNGSGDSVTNLEAGDNTVNGNLSITNLDGFDAARFGASSGTSKLTLKNVSVRNGVGGSRTEFVPTTSANISGQVVISNGAGTDEFKTTGGSFTVAGRLSISNGSGDSTTALEAAANSVGGSLSITNTDGNDEFRNFNDVTSTCTKVTFGAVNIKNGVGDSDVGIYGDNSSSLARLSVTSGGGKDRVGVAAVNIAGNATVNVGSGNMDQESLVVLGAIPGTATAATDVVSIVGNLFVVGADRKMHVGLNRLSVSGTTAITTGNGVDLVEIMDSSFAKAVTVKTGANNDTVFIEVDADGSPTTTTFSGTVNVNLGAGDDRLDVGKDANNKAVFTTAPVKFNGGAGIDTLTKSTSGLVTPPPVLTDIEVELTIP
jgi:uncharacterized protein YxjI